MTKNETTVEDVLKLSGKRTVNGQNSGELIQKSTDGAIPKI